MSVMIETLMASKPAYLFVSTHGSLSWNFQIWAFYETTRQQRFVMKCNGILIQTYTVHFCNTKLIIVYVHLTRILNKVYLFTYLQMHIILRDVTVYVFYIFI